MDLDAAVEAAKETFSKSKVIKQTDGRQKFLTQWFCEECYPAKYGVKYPWSAKEAKLLQRVISWVDSNFEEHEVIPKIQKGLTQYMQDSHGYASKERHPFASFASKVAVWVTREKQASKAIQKAPEVSIKSLTFEEFQEECIKQIMKDPEKFTRGFIQTGKSLQTIDRAKYEWVRGYLFELLGKERSKRLVNESKSFLAPI